MEQTIQINDTTRANVEPDPTGSVEDPLLWNQDDDATHGFGVFIYASCRDNRNHSATERGHLGKTWEKLFVRMLDNVDAEQALRGLRIIRDIIEAKNASENARREEAGLEPLSNAVPAYVGLSSHTGYSQSDWANMLIAGPTKAAAESFANTYELWLQGDCWQLEIERFCHVTQDWYLIPDDPYLGGCLIDACKLEEEVPQIVKDNWGTFDDEFISSLGKAQLKRHAEVEKITRLHAAYRATAHISDDLRLLATVDPLIQSLVGLSSDVTLPVVVDPDTGELTENTQ